ncbi:uncharacterized protein PV09_08893 [Verruconis gallopava]|uniref:Uncharacterized protein n=1 Tax=Verruconis gallopava TaxID=253628 RepID=A0A0D2AKG1_9PEZI|nr:uncharacterized protein PV09_08893 [Verruconis gallopava]KIV99473.1 hypothetical protein PV09_08893 [Verruconis gallopava]
MDICHIQRLPEELLLQVLAEVADLDGGPPSASRFGLEPSAELTKSANQPLKVFSLVCWRWRNVAKPHLFQYARVCLPCDAGWLRLCTGLSQWIRANCRKTPKMLRLTGKIDNLVQSLTFDSSVDVDADRALGFEFMPQGEDVWPTEYYHWMPTAKTDVAQFLNFVQRNNLVEKIKSLVVFAHKSLNEKRSSHEESIIYDEVKTMWSEIFKALPLQRVLVVAPPSTMAVLSGGTDRAWDSWLFQMPYHYLEFSSPQDSTDEVDHTDASLPRRPQGRSFETLLCNIRPWTHMAYNEGTALRGYGQYEYQWKKLPYVFPSLIEWLVKERNSARTPKIRTIEYISLFPYASHLRNFVLGLASMEHLRELKVKLAEPDLLENAELMGKAQPSDAYNEWDHCYRIIGHHFLALAQPGTTFISADTRFAALKSQIQDCIERRSVVPLAHRLVMEEKGDGTIIWKVRDVS